MKTNKAQRDYKYAKSRLDKLEAIQNEQESQYIISKGIVNPDGSIPLRTWSIEDDSVSNAAIEEFSSIIEKSGLWSSICDAREALKVSEENLIAYAISILPAGMRSIMIEAAATNYTSRQKMLETVLQLDVSTVKR
jgi:hypothetical protein